MIRLGGSAVPALSNLRRALTLCIAGHTTLEAVAQQIIDLLHAEFVGDNPASPDVALVRCFVTCPYSALAPRPALQAKARQLLDGKEPEPSHRCMVLLGTRGMEPAWDQRHLSGGHQVIPLGSPELMRKTPMITELCRQIGISRDAFLKEGKLPPLDLAVRNAGCFHIENVQGSPYVPAHADFVQPYGIRSVLGLGAPIDEHDFFVVLIFARVPISAEMAAALKPLTISIKLALSVLHHRLFASA